MRDFKVQCKSVLLFNEYIFSHFLIQFSVTQAEFLFLSAVEPVKIAYRRPPTPSRYRGVPLYHFVGAEERFEGFAITPKESGQART